METDGGSKEARVQRRLFRKGIVRIHANVLDASLSEERYPPQRALENRPSDSSSRWSPHPDTIDPYLTLQLDSCCLLYAISFGKLLKFHPSVAKDIRVLAGPSPDELQEVVSVSLHPHTQEEIFLARHDIDGHPVPIQFVQIRPIRASASQCSPSVPFVEIWGDVNEKHVAKALQYAEEKTLERDLKTCLQRMRKHRWFGPLTSLLENSKEFLNPFESLLNDFYSSLVVERNWDACESLLSQAFELGYFDKAVHREKYVCEWEPLRFLNGEIYPCMRGGHQMVLDEIHRKIYMFGGWSGTEDLDDLWAFDLSSNTWSILFDSCEKVGGPSARSCHHMAIDAVHQKLFVFGKYVATENRDRVRRETNSLSPLSGELFVCDLNLLAWERICSDTATAGGPPLLHDHQMVFDPETRILYFVGGRMLFSTGEDSHPLDKDKKKKKKKKKKTNLDSLSSSTHSLATTPSNPFSSSMDEDLDDLYGDRIMFSGDERRRNDSHYAALSYASVSNLRSPPQSTQNSQLGSDFDSGHHLVRGTDELKPSLFSGIYAYSVDENTWSLCLPDRHRMGGLSRFYSRIGHSIAFDSNKRFLYIFGGQRGANEFFSDLYQYDLDRSELWPICYNSALCGGPERGFTHKMAYDSIHHEIVFCLGLSQGSGVVTSESLTNAVWIFDITNERWKYVPVSENCKKRPIPRYAAQFLYDPSSECYYFHGGNGGPQHGSSERLDDMWRLRIQRPSCESIFRNSLFRLRKLRYLCMIRTEEFSSMDALLYLQEKVSAVVNVNSVDERDEFARLSASFFEDTRISQDSSSKWDEERECVRLFQSLSTILQERKAVPNS